MHDRANINIGNDARRTLRTKIKNANRFFCVVAEREFSTNKQRVMYFVFGSTCQAGQIVLGAQ